MKLQEKLSAIQQKIKVPKSHVNKFANFKYRNAEDILSAVKPLLDGCVLTLTDEVKVLSKYSFISEKVYVNDSEHTTKKEGEYFYVEATAEIRFGEEVMQTKSQAIVDMDKKLMSEEQKTGSASSYARKYALNGLFLLDDDHLDPDSLENVTKK